MQMGEGRGEGEGRGRGREGRGGGGGKPAGERKGGIVEMFYHVHLCLITLGKQIWGE